MEHLVFFFFTKVSYRFLYLTFDKFLTYTLCYSHPYIYLTESRNDFVIIIIAYVSIIELTSSTRYNILIPP